MRGGARGALLPPGRVLRAGEWALAEVEQQDYRDAITALNHARPVIDRSTVLMFDEFIVNKNWEHDEFRALEEFCAANGMNYEVLAVSLFTKQMACRLR